jgi:hypothetical protein
MSPLPKKLRTFADLCYNNSSAGDLFSVLFVDFLACHIVGHLKRSAIHDARGRRPNFA